ncbi:MAG: heavy-metal-associated domain-containing protein [Gammaproteobacteria bacterium]|nr:heavy-metal-associated domain-containing protein [Gammaproteobacteria bacterium]
MAELHYFRINGLNNESDVSKIVNTLSVIDEVESVEVDLDSGMAFIKSNNLASEISLIIDAAGYNSILIAE